MRSLNLSIKSELITLLSLWLERSRELCVNCQLPHPAKYHNCHVGKAPSSANWCRSFPCSSTFNLVFLFTEHNWQPNSGDCSIEILIYVHSSSPYPTVSWHLHPLYSFHDTAPMSHTMCLLRCWLNYTRLISKLVSVHCQVRLQLIAIWNEEKSDKLLIWEIKESKRHGNSVKRL